MPNKLRSQTLGYQFQKTDFWKLRVTFFLLSLLILGNSLWLIKSFQSVKEGQDWVTHTYRVISHLDVILGKLADQETGLRGYFLSRGDTRFLTPYQNAGAEIDKNLANLEAIVSDNPLQLRNVEILKRSITEKQVIMEGGVKRLVEKRDFTTYDGDVLQEGRIGMERIRALADEMKAVEKRLLDQRKNDDEKSRSFVDKSLWASLIINLSLSLLAYFLLKRSIIAQNEEVWLQDRMSDLAISLSGDLDLEELGRKTLQFFHVSLNAPVSSIYITSGKALTRIASFGFDESSYYSKRDRALDETMLGECLLARRPFWYENLADNYLKVSSDLGQTRAKTLVIYPITLEGRAIAAVEVGLLGAKHHVMEKFFAESAEIIARNLVAAENRSKLQELLEETQAQSEELQTQQEELRVTNEELTEQATALNISQEKLLQQQEELRQTNEQLESQAQLLKEQQARLKSKANELEEAKLALEDRARALEQANHYKSEFLANMSHELRTPLNSMLILSSLLKENSKGNLSDEQVSFAETIQNAGNDLLSLINDILDLAKVESGKLDIYLEPISSHSFIENLKRSFSPIAHNKGLGFSIEIASDIPVEIVSDQKRLEQIIRNFLSNAFKFTEKGSVTLAVERPLEKHGISERLNTGEKYIAISVKDTGIGIAPEKQKLIFEAFQQADSSTSRKYGGTGLGLTISRELASLLGGEMILESEFGKGSIFTLIIPERLSMNQSSPDEIVLPKSSKLMAPLSIIGRETVEKPLSHVPRVMDDREDVQVGDKSVLIVEDDPSFSKVLSDAAKRMGFKVLCALDGEQALADLRQFEPSGILLDMKLPGVSGLGLIESIKSASHTRHIPIHVISGVDISQNALRMGALGYLLKPVSSEQLKGAFQKIEDMISRRVRKVLIVEDDERQRHAISRLIQGSDVETDAVGLAAEAQELIRKNVYDCMILDLRLPDKTGLELLDAIAKDSTSKRPPVIVYTGKELSKDEILQLRRYSDSIIIKGVKSPDRLVDEVSLFLHRVEAQLPETQKQLLSESRKNHKPFHDQKVLLADDDLRNSFALMSALEPKGLQITVARNGREALAKLDEIPGVDLVLMDIMMPEMDGYSAMKAIRAKREFSNLPIIALTAKAMRGDQEKCLEAGANDYLPKPIDLERLMSVLKAWLPQKGEF